jgi:hypothetical protein
VDRRPLSFFFWILWGGVLALFIALISHADHLLDRPGEAVIALFTAVLAFSTIGLWAVTGASVEHARKTAETDLRAYVTIGKHRALDYKMEVGNLVVPCVKVKNVGKTQANNVRVAILAAYCDVDDAIGFQLTADPGSSFTLAPGEKSSFTADLPILDQPLIDAIVAKQKAIVLVARVEYMDVFGNPRRTRMRASSIDVNKVKTDGSIQLEWFGEDNDLT